MDEQEQQVLYAKFLDSRGGEVSKADLGALQAWHDAHLYNPALGSCFCCCEVCEGETWRRSVREALRPPR